MTHSKFTLHPWHGISAGDEAPETVTAFIEIVPTDTIKYEVDKKSGWLKVDRPQQFSNIVPALYGFIPQTWCNTLVAEHCMQKTGRQNIAGDKDPMDILVLSEKAFPNGGFLVQAIPIGGFRMIDKNEADDKILAVMKNDAVYGNIKDVSELSSGIVERLKHYFLTYKDMPGSGNNKVEITHIYGSAEAKQIIKHSINDYLQEYGA
ncbi:MAG: inorganic pyrophosphatase [Chitinophagales bacterium]|nr:inorganic pyrophosphatase [Chitinophagales bacterium]